MPYELSAEYPMHSGAARAVCGLSTGGFASAGLDGVVAVFDQNGHLSEHKKIHSDFVLCLGTCGAHLLSGSKDKSAALLEIPTLQVLLRLEGHDGPVSSVTGDAGRIFTGSWDGSFRVWSMKSGRLVLRVAAGPFAVCLALNPQADFLITGTQDGKVRFWELPADLQEQQGSDSAVQPDPMIPGTVIFPTSGFPFLPPVHEISAHTDIVRQITPAAGFFLTCSNDGDTKGWSWSGDEQLLQMPGESFTFSCAVGPAAIATASEDGNLSIWSNGELKQKLKHKATVWSVAAVGPDFVTACQDGTLRVFTADPARYADLETQRNFQASAISEVPKESVRPMSDLQSLKGSKEGEVRMFGNGKGEVLAYRWETGNWVLLGTVMGGTGPSSNRRHYPGDQIFSAGEDDYVFDVEIGSNRKALLPVNKGENPMIVAEKFCAREELGREHIEDICRFVRANAASTETVASQPALTSYFPVYQPTTFTEGKWPALIQKLEQVNAGRISGLDWESLLAACKSLAAKQQLRPAELAMLNPKAFSGFPREPGNFFVVIDLWRLFLCHPQSGDLFKGADRGIGLISIVVDCSMAAGPSDTACLVCCARFFANLFSNSTAKYAAFDGWLKAIPAIEKILKSPATNKAALAAGVEGLVSFSCLVFEKRSEDLGRAILSVIDGCMQAVEVDLKVRLLIAIGTVGTGVVALKEEAKRIAMGTRDEGDPKVEAVKSAILSL